MQEQDEKTGVRESETFGHVPNNEDNRLNQLNSKSRIPWIPELGMDQLLTI